MTRRWTDQELTAAIASSRSWRGTARALGLRGTSAGTIRVLKKRATALALDTAHFTGQRPWSDRALEKAVAESDSWAEVARALSINDAGGTRPRLRGHALRLGLAVTHLEPRPAQAPELNKRFPELAMLRDAAEAIATAWFALRGLAVAVPTRPCAFDLLVTLDEGAKRIQVKTTMRKSSATWTAQIGQRPYVLDKTASRIPYDPDALDLFFIIDGAGLLYLIPIRVVAGRTSINVGAYREFIVGDASSLLAGASAAPIEVGE